MKSQWFKMVYVSHSKFNWCLKKRGRGFVAVTKEVKLTRALTFSAHAFQEHLEPQHSICRWEKGGNGDPCVKHMLVSVLILLVRTQSREPHLTAGS